MVEGAALLPAVGRVGPVEVDLGRPPAVVLVVVRAVPGAVREGTVVAARGRPPAVWRVDVVEVRLVVVVGVLVLVVEARGRLPTVLEEPTGRSLVAELERVAVLLAAEVFAVAPVAVFEAVEGVLALDTAVLAAVD